MFSSRRSVASVPGGSAMVVSAIPGWATSARCTGSATSGTGTRKPGAAGSPRGTTSTRLAVGWIVRTWARNSAAGAVVIAAPAITIATGVPAAPSSRRRPRAAAGEVSLMIR
jgi:hypothetical protein